MEKEKNKLEFEGEYLNGKKNGKGKSYDKNGKLYFEGEYLDGNYHNGKLTKYDENGELLFEGEYINGKMMNGQGKREESCYLNSRYVSYIFEGEYLNGEKKWIRKNI